MSQGNALSLNDLVQLINSSSDNTAAAHTLPSTESVLLTLQQRFKSDLPWINLGSTTLLSVNPLRHTGGLDDATAALYASPESLWPTEIDDRARATSSSSSAASAHPYDFAGRIFASLQRSGKSQAIIANGLSGSGKSYTCELVLSQILRISRQQAGQSTSASTVARRVDRLADQIKAASVLLDAFGAAKTATTHNATRQGRVLELHFKAEDSTTSILSAAKLLTFGLDRSRLQYPLAKEERSFHIFYCFLAGSSAKEQRQYELLEDPSEYRLLASSGCFKPAPEWGKTDEMGYDEVKDAFNTLGIKSKHVDMIFKILSAILLLSNIEFASADEDSETKNAESAAVAHESRATLTTVCSLLSLQEDELERALVNKTSYIRKEVVCSLLNREGACKQRDDLMSALYAILFSYIVECINHRLYPGDEAIKTIQREGSGGSSIVMVDLPGFQTKSPAAGMIRGSGASSSLQRDSTGSMRRSALIQAYGEDGFDQFVLNYSNELLQQWVTRRVFHDDAYGAIRRCASDGVKLPEVDVIDDSAMTLELLRGGLLGSRADSKPGGMLGGLSKTCSNVRKGKIATYEQADVAFMEGMEERYATHSRYIPRVAGRSSSFAIKHYAGTVSYHAKDFVERDVDLLDAEFVRLFRTSTNETFLAKLFSGPSLSAESHPRDPSVLVASQVSIQPLRRLSPLKVSRTSSTSVPNDPPEPDIMPITSQMNESLTDLLAQVNEVPVWMISCIRPNDGQLAGIFDALRIKNQVEAMDLTSAIGRKRIDYFEGCEFGAFAKRYARLGCGADANSEQIAEFLTSQAVGLASPKDFGLGTKCVWLSFLSWRMLESRLRKDEVAASEQTRREGQLADARKALEANSSRLDEQQSMISLAPSASRDTVATDKEQRGPFGDSSDDLLKNAGAAGSVPPLPYDSGFAPPQPGFLRQSRMSYSPTLGEGGLQPSSSDVWGPDFKNAAVLDRSPMSPGFPGGIGEKGSPAAMAGAEKGRKAATVQEVPTSSARRLWLMLVWALTWWIPTLALTYIGRMKRPDVRIAWREKVALCMLIFFVCGALLFFILGLGHILCPEYNNAWNVKQLSYHQGKNDYYAAVAGQVYDLTGFYKAQHSDIQGLDVTDDLMLELAGQDLTPYFPVPLTLGCPDLVKDDQVFLQSANFTPTVPQAMHYSGKQQSVQSSVLHHQDWYTAIFLPKLQGFHKGPLVYTPKDVRRGAENDGRIWAIYRKQVFDISDYVYTVSTMNDDQTYQFLPTALTDIFQEQVGQDITDAVDGLPQSALNSTLKSQSMSCLQNVFYRGEFDFRTTPRCTVQSYFLLAFSIILIATIAAKFLAALQITKKRNPELQDKFIICQVPCYTEGEDSLRRTIDSLANLKYDDKRKLLFVICDGMIVGSGNDRPTPRIVLDILGVENLDPDPLLFKSLGQGNRQLNYGKVYSGLYEFEGHVMPYVVVVKVGKPSERSRPGNRGKRDSQILLMRFLNRVHFDSEMSPLELEIYHQIKNVIGVDPKLYEYLLTVDADTEVTPDSLNRLVATAAEDTSIVGICGETKLSNEQESWWTMIQVYEYYISHHLAKAFESLFGSVTCLPGCFTMFRLRTADKGRPLLISNLVIDDYAENEVDTLHKKNLLHLGEDRYLTTLILKHFPLFKTKFAADARASTAAPERWNVLLSQRRRWINSTIHNLFELVTLKDLCGFCCFSMRFIVMIDLLGTIMLPATTVYLIYLIVTVATSSGSIPIISLVMLGAVYGLQVIIFLLKRQWQFIGWLVIYILAYPVYSFFLPCYAFWHFDDFSWGNTRIVVGEGKNKKILAGDDDNFDDSMIPMRKFSEYQQQAWDLQSRTLRNSPQASEAGFSMAAAAPHQNQRRSSHMSGMPFGEFGSANAAGSRAPTLFNYPMGPQPAFSPFPHAQSTLSMSQSMQMQMQPQYAGYQAYGHSPAGSAAGSDYGGNRRQSSAALRASQMSFAAFASPPGAGSMLGMPYGGEAMQTDGSGGFHNTARNSSYSLSQWIAPQHATSMSMSLGPAGQNPFADPHAQGGSVAPLAADPANPTDVELFTALRDYLRTQDLLQVTKRSTREAMTRLFPDADLSSKKAFLNQSIDAILQGQL